MWREERPRTQNHFLLGVGDPLLLVLHELNPIDPHAVGVDENFGDASFLHDVEVLPLTDRTEKSLTRRVTPP